MPNHAVNMKGANLVRRSALGLVGVVTAIVMTAAPAAAHSKPPKKRSAHHAATHVPSTPGIGDVAKDGDFAFTVHSVTCGITQLGTTVLGTTAPAGTQWCVAHMTVKDDKGTAQTFFASNQKAIDTEGHQLSADTKALVFLTAASEYSSLNPGVALTVQVPYQLPTTHHVRQLILHDSIFSGGVTVSASR